MQVSIIENQLGIARLREIIQPFSFAPAKLEAIYRNFERESAEIGVNRVFFLATLDDHALATVQLILKNADNDPDLANGIEIAHIHNLWVRKDQHRNGYANKLIKHLEEYAREARIETLTLGVDDFNHAAISLYENLGYVKFKLADGQFEGEKLILMKKAIVQ